MSFLPVSVSDMQARGWNEYDFLLVTGDAYVDHPSFGAAVISRVLERAGYRVAVLAQPRWKDTRDFLALGRPKLGAMVTGGNIDSMVAHYTSAKKKRSGDSYSPGGKAGRRPDRAVIVYGNLVRQAFPGLPVILGGLEASLRRFAHYDYWDDAVRNSILADSGADLLVYGMGERAVKEIAARLKKGDKAEQITDVKGTCVLVGSGENCAYASMKCPGYKEVCTDKKSLCKGGAAAAGRARRGTRTRDPAGVRRQAFTAESAGGAAEPAGA